MRNNAKAYFFSTVVYANPATIYWYLVVYKDLLEMASALIASVTLTGVLIYVLRQYFVVKRGVRYCFAGVTAGFVMAILLFIANQFIYTTRVVGYSDLGSGVLQTYIAIGFIGPFFWINSAAVFWTNFLPFDYD
jgi:hypothetical protein